MTLEAQQNVKNAQSRLQTKLYKLKSYNYNMYLYLTSTYYT